jgi:hypothetical protein
MSAIPSKLDEQSKARIQAVGVMQNEHMFSFQKALDWAYELDRKTPSLAEAIGLKQFEKSETLAATPVDQVGNT